jgi:hypothetical protein
MTTDSLDFGAIDVAFQDLSPNPLASMFRPG